MDRICDHHVKLSLNKAKSRKKTFTPAPHVLRVLDEEKKITAGGAECIRQWKQTHRAERAEIMMKVGYAFYLLKLPAVHMSHQMSRIVQRWQKTMAGDIGGGAVVRMLSDFRALDAAVAEIEGKSQNGGAAEADDGGAAEAADGGLLGQLMGCWGKQG